MLGVGFGEGSWEAGRLAISVLIGRPARSKRGDGWTKILRQISAGVKHGDTFCFPPTLSEIPQNDKDFLALAQNLFASRDAYSQTHFGLDLVTRYPGELTRARALHAFLQHAKESRIISHLPLNLSMYQFWLGGSSRSLRSLT